jgi:hypothetical protein
VAWRWRLIFLRLLLLQKILSTTRYSDEFPQAHGEQYQAQRRGGVVPESQITASPGRRNDMVSAISLCAPFAASQPQTAFES